jgi:hypothetical protein
MGVAAGYDNLMSVCGYRLNSAIVGFNALVPNDGPLAYGRGVVYGDGIYDSGCLCISGEQWTVFSKLKANKQNKYGRFVGQWGWVGEAGNWSGFYFGYNFGYLGSTIPGGETATHGTNAGKFTQ